MAPDCSQPADQQSTVPLPSCVKSKLCSVSMLCFMVLQMVQTKVDSSTGHTEGTADRLVAFVHGDSVACSGSHLKKPQPQARLGSNSGLPLSSAFLWTLVPVDPETQNPQKEPPVL